VNKDKKNFEKVSRFKKRKVHFIKSDDLNYLWTLFSFLFTRFHILYLLSRYSCMALVLHNPNNLLHIHPKNLRKEEK